jgi:hypothetical protein
VVPDAVGARAAQGDRITVRHLPNHTSGLYDFRVSIPLPPSQEFLDNRWRTWTAAEQIERAVEDGDGLRLGLGLAWRDLSCGIRVYGNDRDALSYQSWSFATDDTRRQVTVVLTPDFSGDPDDAVDAFLDEAFCG